MKFTIKQTIPISVSYLMARCGVRYWEDATVDGQEDTEGDLIPCREGNKWCPIIDLESGRITNWKAGVSADIHYKICDDGEYILLDAEFQEVKCIDGYVPSMLSPKDNGFGDYVIMDVGPDGVIQNWRADLGPFEGASRFSKRRLMR